MGNLFSTFKSLQASAAAPPSGGLAPLDTRAELLTEFAPALRRMQLLAPGDRPSAVLMHSSARARIYRVDLGWGSVCIKESVSSALANGIEARWLRFARDAAGECAPEVLAEDGRLLAMEYLEPEHYPSWLARLRHGDVSPANAAEIARLAGRLHAASANNFAVARRFGDPSVFRELCIEPRIAAATHALPALASRLHELSEVLCGRTALVHGALVPGNALIGPRGPVLVDAGRACYGDPAFDVASCLAHLLMLCAWRRDWRDRLFLCFDTFCAAYVQRITWELPEDAERRAALAIPVILLGELEREDRLNWLLGRRECELIEAFARTLVLNPVWRLAAVRETWRRLLLD